MNLVVRDFAFCLLASIRAVFRLLQNAFFECVLPGQLVHVAELRESRLARRQFEDGSIDDPVGEGGECGVPCLGLDRGEVRSPLQGT